MSIALYVAGISDRAVEQMLVDSGLRVNRITADELEALALPAAPQPDAVVLDLRRDRRILPLVALLRSHHPTTVSRMLATTSSCSRPRSESRRSM